jgi:hypothetical protein
MIRDQLIGGEPAPTARRPLAPEHSPFGHALEASSASRALIAAAALATPDGILGWVIIGIPWAGG